MQGNKNIVRRSLLNKCVGFSFETKPGQYNYSDYAERLFNSKNGIRLFCFLHVRLRYYYLPAVSKNHNL